LRLHSKSQSSLSTSGVALGTHTLGITGRLLPSGVSNHEIAIEVIVP
jgi:hypothetical protein